VLQKSAQKAEGEWLIYCQGMYPSSARLARPGPVPAGEDQQLRREFNNISFLVTSTSCPCLSTKPSSSTI